MTCLRSSCIDHGKKGNRDGYYLVRPVVNEPRKTGAHRLAYCFARGLDIDMLEGTVVRHTCDNSRCINPQHLILGTHQDNHRDMCERGRIARGERSSKAKLTTAQVLEIRAKYVPRSSHANQTVLAKLYGITQGHITRILAQESWQHV